MKKFLQRLLKSIAYVAASLVILLAIGVGLFRLLLPRLPEYQEEIKTWANTAIGMEVEFSSMDARWRLNGPELYFYDASLTVPDVDGGRFAAEEVIVGVGLMRLLVDRMLIVDRVSLRQAEIDVRQNTDGTWIVQGVPVDALTARFTVPPGARDISVVGQDLTLHYQQADDGADLALGVDFIRLNRAASVLDIEAVVELPETLGSRVQLTAGQRGGPGAAGVQWQVTAEGRGLDVAGWSALQPAGLPVIEAGRADLSLAFQWRDGRIANAVADFSIRDLAHADFPQPVGTDGRIEFQQDQDGWLLAAQDFRLHTQDESWPASTLRLQAGLDGDGRIDSINGTASYLDLSATRYAMPWLDSRQREMVRRYDASGTVRDLDVALGGLQEPEPRFDIGMDLDGAGVIAGEQWPGMRGFTGSLRANRSGGRLQIDADGMELDLSRWLAEPVRLDVADGTVIWRRGDTGVTVLSDNITLQNADFSSRSSLHVSLPDDGGSPVVDLESRFSVSDLGTAKRYLPVNLIRPALYRWLNGALVAGRVTEGTVRFNGPLESFPFDDDDGVFRIDATLANSTLRYSPQWPAAENLELDLVIDRTRLYSDNNTATNAGNSVVDAEIEIADLRDPVLTIDAFATGTMASIRRFVRESPIASVFGRHLDRVTTSGDASFNLLLNYPILNRSAYDFTTRIQVSDATLRVDGFAPPVTELNGIVQVTRNDVEAESLFGRLLDAPVTIELERAGDGLPAYNVIARLAGTLSADGLATGFSLPIDRIAGGETPYSATLMFPRGGTEDSTPFSVAVETDMNGMGLDLPAPLGKPADAMRPLSLSVEFPANGSVDAVGRYGDDIEWNLRFERRDDGWDFDRGVLAAGGAEAGVADTRGLHIVGTTPELHVGQWVALAAANRSDGAAGGPTGLGDRVRALDLMVDDLYLLGQHFGEHRVIVDRSANTWMAQLSGAEAEGLLTIPYDFNGSQPLIVDMERLVLPGSDDDSDSAAIATDPRELPPILVRVNDFALGARRLGRVDAEFARTPGGLAAERFRTASESFTIEGAARWEVDTRDPSGQRTQVTAVLSSSDIDATMQALDSEPGIDGEDMEIRFDVSWSGGPREDFMDSLDGNVVVRLGTGQLNEVEPGAARMFGLMSVVALPRRLALDFRDVLDRGFLFDEITGTFQLDNGNAYTCDLSLKGPAADIGIVGRAGLVVKDYDQSAIVSPNVGNTLPVVGAVVAGPQVAAALLIFSQIFKKPLQEMGQVYYAIGGSWDQPVVETADARHFASLSNSADCIEAAE